MTNPNKSLCVLIVDRSGSMLPIQNKTIEGLNSFVDQQRPVEGLTFGVVTFSEDIDSLLLAPAGETRVFTKKNYSPAGGTRLLDAIGNTINVLGAHLACLPEDDRPARVSIAIMTDGEENMSHLFKLRQIFDMISHQTDKYGWQFLYLGANQDAFAVGSSLGIKTSGISSYSTNDVSRVMKCSGSILRSYNSGARGQSLDLDAAEVQSLSRDESQQP